MQKLSVVTVVRNNCFGSVKLFSSSLTIDEESISESCNTISFRLKFFICTIHDAHT